MSKIDLTKLIESGAHFGHLTRRWNPKMKPYIFMEKNGIHIIDLKKTQNAIEFAAEKISEIASEGKKILFVGTKKQAKGVVAEQARRCDSYWVSERWLGGMLTNFSTIRKSIKHLQNIDKMETDGTFEKITKKERLHLSRERDKLRKILDGVELMNRLPGALFIVDIKKEAIAVKEALRLNIPIFAIVDTNCDPDDINYIIPANDDAVRAIEIIVSRMADLIIEGNKKAEELKAEETAEKERMKKQKEEESGESKKEGRKRVRKVKFDAKGAKASEVTEIVDVQNKEEDSKEKSEETETIQEETKKSEETPEPEAAEEEKTESTEEIKANENK